MAGKGKGADPERAEELEFKCRRVLALQREFDGLFFALAGARCFFRDARGEEEREAAVTM